MTSEIEVPTAITGFITDVPDIDFCMDGATHLIHSFNGAMRLKGRNGGATDALVKVSGTRQKVTVMGYPVIGPECSHLSVYSVSDASEVINLMGGEYWPWKTFNLQMR